MFLEISDGQEWELLLEVSCPLPLQGHREVSDSVRSTKLLYKDVISLLIVSSDNNTYVLLDKIIK